MFNTLLPATLPKIVIRDMNSSRLLAIVGCYYCHVDTTYISFIIYSFVFILDRLSRLFVCCLFYLFFDSFIFWLFVRFCYTFIYLFVYFLKRYSDFKIRAFVPIMFFNVIFNVHTYLYTAIRIIDIRKLPYLNYTYVNSVKLRQN